MSDRDALFDADPYHRDPAHHLWIAGEREWTEGANAAMNEALGSYRSRIVARAMGAPRDPSDQVVTAGDVGDAVRSEQATGVATGLVAFGGILAGFGTSGLVTVMVGSTAPELVAWTGAALVAGIGMVSFALGRGRGIR